VISFVAEVRDAGLRYCRAGLSLQWNVALKASATDDIVAHSLLQC
jgi:hypothetical protein